MYISIYVHTTLPGEVADRQGLGHAGSHGLMMLGGQPGILAVLAGGRNDERMEESHFP